MVYPREIQHQEPWAVKKYLPIRLLPEAPRPVVIHIAVYPGGENTVPFFKHNVAYFQSFSLAGIAVPFLLFILK